jgi:ribonuclease P protein component
MMMQSRHTFRKAERLCSKKHIEALFAGDNRSLTAYPLRAVYTETKVEKIVNSNLPNCKLVSLLISVSKRHFKHAVDRNRAKRLIREAYRLNKGLLLDHLPEDTQLDLAFIWMSDELCDYAVIETKMKTLLQRIAEKINGEGF